MFDQPNSQFVRRYLFLGSIQALLLLCLIGRMFHLQIIEVKHYQLKAEGNRVATKLTPPFRGQIYDRNGVPLATNETSFSAVLMGDEAEDVNASLNAFSSFIYFDPQERKKLIKSFTRKRGLDSLVVKEGLTWEEVSQIEMHLDDLPGVSVEVGYVRKYPFNEIGAHLIGYIAAASEAEQQEDDILSVPGVRVGKNGIEKFFDKILRGSPGEEQMEVNAHRQVVRPLAHFPSISGQDIKLTIDVRLQELIQQRLSEFESASAVVIDIPTGEILAMVSSPSYNPNLFPQGIHARDWSALMNNPYVPLTNKAISGLYAPGSTIKILVALAALRAGIIDEQTQVYCPGYMYLGNHKFHCWCKDGHGHVNVEQAVAQSCDVFFYETAKRLGIEKMAETYREFGLGEIVLNGFPQEKRGLVPDKEWKKENKKADWRVSDSILTSIGQGYLLATPLQLAVMAASIAKGKKIVPTIFKRSEQPVFDSLNYEGRHISLIQAAMGMVSNDPRGTAYRWHIPDTRYALGGKTGTSQVRRITLQQRAAGLTKTMYLPWKYREHGLFIGFAPAHNPRFAIAVVVEHAGGNGTASRTASAILWETQRIYAGEKM